MEEVQETQLSIRAQEAKEGESHGYENESNQPISPQTRKLALWIRIGIYSFLVLSGQAVATLLQRLYYERGGKSKWMAAIVQLAGFPILLPYYFFPNNMCKTKTNHSSTTTTTHSTQSNKPSILVVASLYLVLGLFIAANCYLFSVGLMYLPVSTYSIISASQLAFNAFFSFFLNSQKFTLYIINSLVLLTISSVLLVFEPGSQKSSSKVSRWKYAVGFVCTVGGSAGYGLLLSLNQLLMNKVLKKESFSVIVDVLVFELLVASVAILLGLFASSEWATLREEMNEFELGKVSYVMTLSWTAITWQAFYIGTMGLILEVSSLFSNALSVLGLLIVPVLAVFLFQEKMDGIKVMSMVLAIWGFFSYAYQNYLDNHSSKNDNPISNG